MNTAADPAESPASVTPQRPDGPPAGVTDEKSVSGDDPSWLVGMDRDELRGILNDAGEKPYRGDQLYNWIYVRGAESFNEMTDISRELAGRLEKRFHCGPPMRVLRRIDSADGSARFLMELTRDGSKVETVFIPDEPRRTVCLSTQSGCRFGCRFCRTASIGFRRSLDPGEIVGQFMLVRRHVGLRTGWNVVLMGMGEPLDNPHGTARSVSLLTDPRGLAVSRNRLTLSTVGIIPELKKVKRFPVMPKIAISLNATTDRIRSRIMPVNRKYPLEELLAACRSIPLRRGNRITFEYVLLRGVNDSDEDARRLPGLLRGIPAKVNLIPFNEYPGCTFRSPSPERVSRFQSILLSASVNATIRRSRGSDIGAACGQLAGEDWDP